MLLKSQKEVPMEFGQIEQTVLARQAARLTERGGNEEGRDKRAGAEPPAFRSSAQAPSCCRPLAALDSRSSNCSKPSGPARSPCSSSLYSQSSPDFTGEHRQYLLLKKPYTA